MGNRGMTNWKFIAFFAIALILTAGLFTNAAIAGNGDGKVSVHWLRGILKVNNDTGARTEVPGTITINADSSNTPLPAGSTANSLLFRYDSNGEDMRNGKVRIAIPDGVDGWDLVKKGITVYDSDSDSLDVEDRIFVLLAAGTADHNLDTIDDAAANQVLTPEQTAAKGRVSLVGDLTAIEITLTRDWGANNTRVLGVLFNVVTAATPTRLDESDDETTGFYDSNRYVFTTSSQASNGVFTRLLPYVDDNDTPADTSDDVTVRDTQPRVKVGNARSGSGTVTLDPGRVYTGDAASDKLKSFEITYTAAGPIYDYDDNATERDVDASITITIPMAVEPLPKATDNPPNGNGFPSLTVTNTSGTVRFSNPRFTYDNNTVRVNISRMSKGAKVVLTYKATGINGAVETSFVVAVDTGDYDADVQSVPVKDKDGKVVTRLAYPKAGSGTLTISPSPVLAVADRTRTFTLVYTAPTALGVAAEEDMNVLLRIAIPGAIGLPMNDATPPAPIFDPAHTDYVTGTSKGRNISAVDADDPETRRQIIWDIPSLAAGEKFTTSVKKVTVPADADVLTWNAYVSVGDPDTANLLTFGDAATAADSLGATGTAGMAAQLYVVKAGAEDVAFSMNPDVFRAADTKQTITFTFEARNTPIEDGAVWFRVPSSGWTRPVAVEAGGDDDIGEVTATIIQDLNADNDTEDDGESVAIDKADISTGYQTRIEVASLIEGGEIAVTYKHASIQPTAEQGVKIYGYYNALSTSSSSRVTAGVVDVDISNVADGTGTAEIKRPVSVKAGSSGNLIEIEYKPVGTMDNGSLSLSRPDGWGAMQRDPEKANYIDVRLNGRSLDDDQISTNGTIVVVYLEEGFDHRDRITFLYGGGTGADKGVKVQDTAGNATFLIESRGSGAGSFLPVRGTEFDGDVAKEFRKVNFEKGTTDAYNGLLRIEVTGGDDGSGSATVDITGSKAGPQDYIVVATDGTESTETLTRVHAGDDSTYITFVYTASQPITNGQIQFIAPTGEGWSKPQESDKIDGYTRIDASGDVEPPVYNADGSVTADIVDLPTGATITIHYGSFAFASDTTGGAQVPDREIESRFLIKIKGSDGTSASLQAIDGTADNPPKPLTVMVYPQASGGGSAMIRNRDSLNLRSGDESTSLQIVYTANGEIDDGAVRLTIPADWSMATSETVEVSRSGAVLGGDLDADGLTEEGITAMQALVKGVSMGAGQTITFTYTGAVQPAEGDDVQFVIASDGGAGPGEGVMDLADLSGLTVDVGGAGAGSGSAEVSPKFVTVGDEDVALTFTYTAAGEVGYPKIISVNVDDDWAAPTADDDAQGSYTVTDAEELAPNGQTMRARIANGTTLAGEGTVVFTYTADAPTVTGTSRFAVSFDGSPVGTVTVNIQPASGATDLMVMAPESLKTEDGPVMVTLQLSAEGDPASSEADVEITLSSSSATGMFSATTGVDAEYTAELAVTITADDASAMVYYMDSTLGISTITASAPSLTATDATATISVDTEETAVTEGTIDVTPSVANAGMEVTVSGDGTPNQTATFSVGAIVTTMGMDESPAGTYSGSFTVVVDQHADGTYDVTVNVNGATGTATGALTIDSTAPTVTVAAVEGTVANGGDVMISAAVADAGTGVASVTADVSMLDDQATAAVALTDADGDGTYTGSHTISTENGADNGPQTITVTAADNAGNSGDGSTDVELLNVLSYTATIPAGISLLSVPVADASLATVGDLADALANENLLITYDGANWNSRSSGVMITASLGILISMSASEDITFEGNAWADTSITLAAGSNLVGLPVNDASVTNVSDISGLFAAGVVQTVIFAADGSFKVAAAADDAAVAGHAAYLVVATVAGSATLSGDGWSTDDASAAPIALAGYTVDNQTPVLDVHGSVLDEITGLAKEGFRVKVKNLSTKAALSNITTVEAADGYNMTFVDLSDSYAARVGDVLEISADSPNPLIGIQPVRHTVTVDDVKNGTIQLEDLIAYEIPAETELLRNYPNPFNPETWIPYHLSEDADVNLTIYDINGEVVRDIDVGHQTAAKYDSRAKAIYWDGRNRFGEQVASGIYFYHLDAGEFSGTRKMVILK